MSRTFIGLCLAAVVFRAFLLLTGVAGSLENNLLKRRRNPLGCYQLTRRYGDPLTRKLLRCYFRTHSFVPTGDRNHDA